MIRRWLVGGVMAAACAALGGCQSDPDAEAEAEAASEPAADLLRDTSAGGRVAFGCALERGIDSDDETMRHYGHLATRPLFVAALEDRQRYVTAARLWHASDVLLENDTPEARAELLEICSAAGFEEQAGLHDLRSYMCAMTADLAEDRPNLGSFGPTTTKLTVGDPRRNDATFISFAHFLLALREDSEWFQVESPLLALEANDDRRYREALREVQAHCSAH